MKLSKNYRLVDLELRTLWHFAEYVYKDKVKVQPGLAYVETLYMEEAKVVHLDIQKHGIIGQVEIEEEEWGTEEIEFDPNTVYPFLQLKDGTKLMALMYEGYMYLYEFNSDFKLKDWRAVNGDRSEVDLPEHIFEDDFMTIKEEYKTGL